MKVDAPPINGSARQKLAWLAGVALTLLTILMLAGGGAAAAARLADRGA